MSTLTELLESFPQELRVPMARLVDALKEELQVTKADFIELRAVVQELAEVQRRTERDLGDLRGVVQELAQAHRGTEQALRELAETQTKFSRTFYAQMGALGARWGLRAERAFQEGMRPSSKRWDSLRNDSLSRTQPEKLWDIPSKSSWTF